MKHLLLASRHPFPPYSRGGGELCALELLERLADSFSCDIRVLTADASGTAESYTFRNATVMRVAQRDFLNVCTSMFASPDLAGIITYLEGAATVARLAREHSIPVGLLVVDCGGLFDGLSAFPVRPAATVVISKYLAALARECFGIASVHFPPPLAPLRSDALIAPLMRFGRRTVGMVNPNLVKGGLLFEQLAQSMPGISFLAIRGWSYEDIAPPVQLTSKNITTMDWTEKIDNFYAKISILAVPSLCPEGFGRVVREGLIRGIPVLASERGALLESGCDAVTLLDPTIVDPWSEAVDALLNDFTLFKRVAMDGQLAATLQAERDVALAEQSVRAIGTSIGL